MIQFNSFPRSGHHLVVNAAAIAFPSLSYCEKYHCTDQWLSKIPCSGENLPLPCKLVCRAGKLVQKSHDFDLTDPVLESMDFRYFILVRNPFNSIFSWWLLNVQHFGQLDDEGEFRNFFIEKCHFWNAFCKKWVVPSANLADDISTKNMVYATYEQIVREKSLFCKAVKFLLPPSADFLVDRQEDKIFESVVSQSRKLSEFKYYSEALMRQGRDIVNGELLSILKFEQDILN